MYLSYSEYQAMGGVLEETAFNSLECKARYLINAQASGKTGVRIKNLAEIPECIKDCVYELVSFLNANKINDKPIASESQSQGGASESVSYVSKTEEELNNQAENIICDFFYGGGVGNLLYRGNDL